MYGSGFRIMRLCGPNNGPSNGQEMDNEMEAGFCSCLQDLGLGGLWELTKSSFGEVFFIAR